MDTSIFETAPTAKYDTILQLIMLWQEFEQLNSSSARLEDFSEWMHGRLRAEKHHQTERSEPIPHQAGEIQRTGAFPADGTLSHVRTDTDGTISILIGRMWRYSKMYLKKAFEGQAISSIDEFALLAAIMQHEQAGEAPTKSEVYISTLTEVTTGSEIMRRLEKAGLVEEYTDTKDKRMKRVKLTANGTRAFFQAAQQMGAASKIVAGTLTDNQKLDLITLLTLLDTFHSKMYIEHRTESFSEIGSLAAEERKKPIIPQTVFRNAQDDIS